MRMMAWWRRNSEWDQQDYGLPPEGWRTAFGWYVPA
jgi:hypothetical protein